MAHDEDANERFNRMTRDEIAAAERRKKELYALMTYFVVAKLHIYGAESAIGNREFAEKYKGILKRIRDEAQVIFKYNLEDKQVEEAILTFVHLQAAQQNKSRDQRVAEVLLKAFETIILHGNQEQRDAVKPLMISAATGPHPSHETRASDASTCDEVCIHCGARDQVPGGWGTLALPCSKPGGKSRSDACP